MGGERSCIVIAASPGGSLGRCFRGVAEALAARGHRVLLLVPPSWLGRVELEGVEVVAWAAEPGGRGAPRALLGAVRDLRRWRPDLVVGSFGGDLLALAAARAARVPRRAVFHHSPNLQMELDAGRTTRAGRARVWRRGQAYRAATHVLCATPRVEADLLAMGVPAERVRRLPYAIPDPGVGAAERVPGRVVMTGRFDGSKAHDTMVRAFARVVAEVPEASLVLVGEGPLRSAVEALAASLGVAGSVTFTGHVPHEQLFAEVGRAEVACVPSRDEGFGLVTIEAQGMGTPVVATAIGATEVTVDAGVTGLVVPVDDDAALAAAVVELLSDPERRTRMGGAARQWFLERFCLERRADEMAAVYESLLAPSAAPGADPAVAPLDGERQPERG